MGKRVQIIDFNHITHTMFHSNYRLSAKVCVNGQFIEKDTTIQNGCIKNVHRWAKGGFNPTAVCFDRPVPARKNYWQTAFNDMKVGSESEYKGKRERMPDAMYEGIHDCEMLLRQAGVSCYSRDNYEADDLVFACIQRAKEKYPDLPIDVVTNDADLLPLVDEQVSVFIRSKKMTYAESKDIEKAHYIQVTPDNFQSVVEDLSAYKGFYIPYNTLLLHKLLRGDSSDGFQRKEISKMFPKTKYNAFIQAMERDRVNFLQIFRYSQPEYEIFNKLTGDVFNGTMEDAKKSPEKANLRKRIKDSDELSLIVELLGEYTRLTEEQIDTVRKVYLGMNLNQPYVAENKLLTRPEFKVGGKGTADIETFSQVELQKVIQPLQIRLSMF